MGNTCPLCLSSVVWPQARSEHGPLVCRFRDNLGLLGFCQPFLCGSSENVTEWSFFYL